MDQCVGPSENAQMLNMVLNALNIGLAAWLVHRRRAADLRERNGNGKELGSSRSQLRNREPGSDDSKRPG
jgi:hypothetical protein